MRRIYPDYAYGDGPRDNCWWDETISAPTWPQFDGTRSADVAIIGGGFTGISAALHLAEAGVDVAVLEANSPGWGASGRNGGFCCIGGAKLTHTAIAKRYGVQAAHDYSASEIAAVDLAKSLIAKHHIHADTHSSGETILAHSRGAWDRLRTEAAGMAAQGQAVELIEQTDLIPNGLNGHFFGALTTPVGFGLNPRKYLFGLSDAAQKSGARLYQESPVVAVEHKDDHHLLKMQQGTLRAKKLVIATNGYSSENIPTWLRARYLPCQSSILVTRPLTETELARQGWTSDQMAYDTRHLLHYFRLMPDRRFLFGMRGGLISSSTAEERIRRQLLSHFHRLFPAWSGVEITNKWSGLVSMGASLVPFIGKVAEVPGMFAGLNYHGNGVAMGTYSGHVLASLIRDKTPEVPYSTATQTIPRFPLGAARRVFLPLAYGYYGLKDLSLSISKTIA